MRHFISGMLLATVLFIAAESCTHQRDASASSEISPDSLVKRGDYLVTIMGCDDCHSTKKMGPSGPEIDLNFRFGGHIAGSPVPPVPDSAGKNGWVMMSMDLTMAIGPWGTSYAANISPHENGIGNWTEEQFITALRKGKQKGLEGSRGLLPPMPWFNYRLLTDTDIKAIFAFLKSSRPVDNIVPASKAP